MKKLILPTLILFLFSYCRLSVEPEKTNLVRGSYTRIDTLKHYEYSTENTKIVYLPATENYFEFKIRIISSYIKFMPLFGSIQKIPEDGNKLLAPLTRYTTEESSSVAVYQNQHAESNTTFFYLSSDRTLYGRLDCKVTYDINQLSYSYCESYIKLEYTWMIRTDGERSFPK